MSVIQKLIPTNILAEKKKFFADFSYNPQFVYAEEVKPSMLTEWGSTQKKYAELAREILEKTYFGRNESDLLLMEGKKLSQKEIDKKIRVFLEMHHLQERYQVIWSSSFVSRATITKDTLKLKSTAQFYKEGLIGLLYHEIGTHALRRMNYEKQPWYKKKKEYGLTTPYLRTEEGMATLHSLVAHTFPSAYTS